MRGGVYNRRRLRRAPGRTTSPLAEDAHAYHRTTAEHVEWTAVQSGYAAAGTGSWWSKPSNVGHLALDLGGMIPVAGAVFDLANAGWYAYEGDYENAIWSGAAAIPGIGDAAMAIKWGKRGVEAAGAGYKLARAATRGADIGVNFAQGGSAVYQGYQSGNYLQMGVGALGIGMNVGSAKKLPSAGVVLSDVRRLIAGGRMREGGTATKLLNDSTIDSAHFNEIANWLKAKTGTTIHLRSGRAKLHGNHFDPVKNEIHLTVRSKSQPRGMFYEEVQHALDFHANPDHSFWKPLSEGKLHAITFENLALNSKFNLSLNERAAFLAEALRQAGR